MSSYKEIVTKAVIGKGKKLFTNEYVVDVEKDVSTILGCWVINHNFHGEMVKNDIVITGSFDVNIWYSYDDDTKTDVLKETKSYQETVHMRHDSEDSSGEDIIVRSLKQPTCSEISIDGNKIHYTIEKELGIELVGDVKVKIEANEDEEPWDEVIDDTVDVDTDKLDDSFINENI